MKTAAQKATNLRLVAFLFLIKQRIKKQRDKELDQRWACFYFSNESKVKER